jgi:membrane protein YdbS with pleckstrin-like domain
MSSMFVFIVILLLLAAVFGILGVVLKTALVITLAILLTIAFLSLFTYYWFRYRVYRYRRELDRQSRSS